MLCPALDAKPPNPEPTRGEIEDAHFSKPVCSKCAEKRKMLQNLPYTFANFRPLSLEEKTAMKAEGREPKPAFTFADQNEIEDLDEAYMEKYKIIDVPNFRLGWKKILEGHQAKLDEMYAAMAKVQARNPKPLNVGHQAEVDEMFSLRSTRCIRFGRTVAPPVFFWFLT